MGCIDLVRCVLVLRCGMAVVVWYPYAGFSLHLVIAIHQVIKLRARFRPSIKYLEKSHLGNNLAICKSIKYF